MRASTALRSTLLALTTVAALLPAGGAASAHAPDPVSADLASSAARAAEPVKTRNRSYGGKVVQNFRDQRLRIQFRGSKGDLVAARSFPNPAPNGCETTVMRSLENDRLVAQQVSALWRLPKSGRYAMTYSADCFQPVGNDDTGDGSYRSGVRLSKVVTHALTPGGPAVDLPLDNKVLHVAVLTVADARGVAVSGEWSDGQDRWASMVLPPSMESRSGRGDTFNSRPDGPGSPFVVRQGVALPLPYLSPGFGFVPSVGDEIWFSDPRAAARATASYVE